jgi:signal transduction histidine kinase
MVLAGVAAIYLSGHAPFPQEWASANPQVFSAPRILGDLAVQVLALFLVDLLGGLLMGRLHEHRLFAGEVLDQLGEGVLAVDRHGHVAYVNAEAVRLLGLSDVPQAGVSASAALADQGLAEVRALLASARLPVLERWRGPAGRHLVLRVTQLTGRRGQEIGRSLLIADETRLATLEASARRAEGLAALGEMAAGIAHEIRNPLTSLRGCAQELAEVAVRSQRTEDAQLAQLIVSESDRLGRIVSDFLQMSRMRPPLRSDIELAPVIDGVRSLCAAHGDGPALSVQVAQELPRVHADAEQVRQVLLNLVNNARDAVGGVADPRIELRVAEAGEDNPLPGEAVMLQVVDNGPGMAPELLERVFTPFFSTKPQGTGLGLSLVSRIVREHEGVLRLDSTPGKGTVATIYLPTSSQTRAFKRALGGGG